MIRRSSFLRHRQQSSLRSGNQAIIPVNLLDTLDVNRSNARLWVSLQLMAITPIVGMRRQLLKIHLFLHLRG